MEFPGKQVLFNRLSGSVNFMLDLLLGRNCNICGRSLHEYEHLVCCQCVSALPVMRADVGKEGIVKLLWGIAPIHRGAFLFKYDNTAAYHQLIHTMKYRRRPDVCRYMGRLLYGKYQPIGFFEDIDLIVPVPLYKRRQRERGYNQSEEVAKGISEYSGLPIDTVSMVRCIDNMSQTRLSAVERQRNVENIFAVVHPESLSGKHLLIIDDIVTTGATIKEFVATIYAAAPSATFSVMAVGAGGNQLML